LFESVETLATGRWLNPVFLPVPVMEEMFGGKKDGEKSGGPQSEAISMIVHAV
jgi:hypothetical protein